MSTMEPRASRWKEIFDTIFGMQGAGYGVKTALNTKLRKQIDAVAPDICEMTLDDYNTSVSDVTAKAKAVGFVNFPAWFRPLSLDEANARRVTFGCGVIAQTASSVGIGTVAMIGLGAVAAIAIGYWVARPKNGKNGRGRKRG